MILVFYRTGGSWDAVSPGRLTLFKSSNVFHEITIVACKVYTQKNSPG